MERLDFIGFGHQVHMWFDIPKTEGVENAGIGSTFNKFCDSVLEIYKIIYNLPTDLYTYNIFFNLWILKIFEFSITYEKYWTAFS